MKITEPLFQTENLDERIAIIERKIGYSLPRDYVEFLMRTNGGRPDDAFFSNSDGDGSTVNFFYGISEASCSYDLMTERNRKIDFIPPDYLVIGADSFGNFVLIRIGEVGGGKIFFLDHETYDYETGGNLIYMTDSFGSFLRMLS